jgi:site-specific DNA recombinase
MARNNAAAPPAESAPKVVRCAIYTRKSTEEGLNQEFNSLDAKGKLPKHSLPARDTKAGR